MFETYNLDRTHPITGEMDDVFWCPQSRHSGISDKVLEEARMDGRINLLAHSEHGGYSIFESADQTILDASWSSGIRSIAISGRIQARCSAGTD